MAPPTVSSLQPPVGHTGGRVLCELLGTAFALPPPPPPTGIVPVPPPSVSVTFGGIQALEVAVESATQLYALAPPSPASTVLPNGVRDWGPGFVDVVVQNLDANGNPILGESVTLSQAFEYRRPDLSKESHPTIAFGRLIEEFRKQICPNVEHAKHTDWTDGGLSIDLSQIATMPALVIVDLEFGDSAQHPQGPQAVDLGDGNFARRREPDAVDAVMTVVATAELDVEVQNLAIACKLFFKKNPVLQVPRSNTALNLALGAYDLSGTLVDYTLQFQITDPIRTSAGGNNSNLKTFTFQCAIRGILVEDWPGVVEAGTSDTPSTLAHEATVGITTVADEIDLATQGQELA